MGVKDLWQLLEPVGRRINIEALTNKQLAVDASIWLHQFIKAMRNEKGEVLQNAHLVGFFRRICRLLFHKIRPVFVFDGATPVLKRRTAIARRRRREQQTAQLRKTAEKLLLNQLKRHVLKAKAAPREAQPAQPQLDVRGGGTECCLQRHTGQAWGPPSGCGAQALPAEAAGVDAERDGGVSAGPQVAAASGVGLGQDRMPSPPVGEAAADEAASDEHAAGEEEEEEEEDEDDADGEEEELLLPKEAEGLDPAVLSSLPQSMQLEALQRMREHLTLLNRDKFQQQSVNPAGFSVLQMQEYLRASQFRRQIDNLKDAMNTAAMASNGGTVAKKIASEVDRQYILAQEGPRASPSRQPLPPGRRGAEGEAAVEVEVPASCCLEDLLQKSDEGSSRQTSDSEEWQDVGAPALPDSHPASKEEEGRGPGRLGWRERMQQRQKYWSLSHGFKFGRKLADWSKSDEQEEVRMVREAAGVVEEEEELQEAIRRSLLDRSLGGAGDSSSDSGSSQDWVVALPPSRQAAVDSGAGPSHEAGPSPLSFGQHGRLGSQANGVPPSGPSLGSQANGRPPSGPSLGEGSGGRVGAAVGEAGASAALHRGRAGQEAALLPSPGAPQQPTTSAARRPSPSAREVVDLAGLDDWASPPSRAHPVEREEKVPPGVPSEASAGPHVASTEGPHPGGLAGSLPEAPRAALDVRNGRGFPAAQPTSAAPAGRPVEEKSQDGRQVQQAPQPRAGIGVEISEAVQKAELEDFNIDSGMEESGEAGPGDESGEAGAGKEVKEVGGGGDEGKEEVRGLARLGREVVEEVMEAARAGGFSEEELAAALQQADDWDFLDSAAAPSSMPPTAGAGAQPPAMARDEGAPIDFDAELELLDIEQQALEADARRQQIAGEAPTNEMYGECQELLQMFGIPYIIAPMEAEAQCAWLDRQGLVQGVITDDNDVFLFGARSVYRNIFSDRKYVEEYRLSDVESELGLDQVGLIQLALLLGSDYTEGIHGIGIVNAVEVVHAFPGESGLEAFRKWVLSPDEQLLALARVETTGGEVVEEDAALREFKRKHAGVRKNWDVPEGFPQAAIMRAYLSPRVDDCRHGFSYGRPDIDLLRTFCWEKFGWSRDKSEQLLLPVLKAYDERQTQTTMTQFLTFSQRFAKFKSVRLQRAVKGVSGKASEDLHYMDTASPSQPKRARASKPGERKPRKKKAGADEGAGGSDISVKRKRGRPAAAPSKKRKKKPISSQGSSGGDGSDIEDSAADPPGGAPCVPLQPSKQRPARACTKPATYEEPELETSEDN